MGHKSKKEKKDKKRKRSKNGHDDGGDGNDDGDDEWVEAPAPVSADAADDTTPAAVPAVSMMPQPIVPARTEPPAPVQREAWMLKSAAGGLFSRPRVDDDAEEKAKKEKEAQERAQNGRSDRELNKFFTTGAMDGLPPEDAAPKKAYEFGDGGSSWRMTKLKRVYEIAKNEGRLVEDVALDRYGSLEEFRRAQEEREFVDRRGGDAGRRGRDGRDGRGSGGGGRDSRRGEEGGGTRERYAKDFKRPNFDDDDDRAGGARRQSRQPDSDARLPDSGTTDNGAVRGARDSNPSTSLTEPGRGASAFQPPHQPQAPRVTIAIPSVIPYTVGPTAGSNTVEDREPVLSRDELNKMQAQILKASIMGGEADPALVARYEREKARAEARGGSSGAAPASGGGVTVLPTIDVRGRLINPVGGGETEIGAPPAGYSGHLPPGNSKKRRREKDGLAAADQRDEDETIAEMVMHEKTTSVEDNFYDAQMARRIARDAAYRDSTDYMDDRADKLATTSRLTADAKRQRSIGEHRRQTKGGAASACQFCADEDSGAGPAASVLAAGTRAYLALPLSVDMVPHHCLIVPTQHVLTTLECDDDVWDEIRNFMKCLIQMQWELGNGMIFMEQVINFKWAKHSVIECVPVPLGLFEDAPAYFKEAINSAGEEWSQHRKLIDTSKNGGFRRSMVKNLPYFHVWFEPNKGYGHVIEDGKAWEEWFGREVLGSMMQLPPDRWRRPRRADPMQLLNRRESFLKAWKKFDWTQALQ